METKKVGLAIFLSLLIPGGGHAYIGRYASAIFYLVFYILIIPFFYGFLHATTKDAGPILLLLLIGLIVWCFSIYSVFVDTNNYNISLSQRVE